MAGERMDLLDCQVAIKHNNVVDALSQSLREANELLHDYRMLLVWRYDQVLSLRIRLTELEETVKKASEG